MDIFFIVILGLVQGLTEFLPVSSTGHLILLEKLFNLSSDRFGLSFDVALHIGTFLALIIYFRNKLADIFKGVILVGTIPAVIVGVIFESLIRNELRSESIVAVSLIIFSFVFLYAERKSKKNKSLDKISIKDSLIIGFFQSIALIPGVSRSGITMSGGFLRNLDEKGSGEFAFLLSIPIIAIASAKDLFSLAKSGISTELVSYYALGAFTSFIVGYICIYYFLSYLKKHGLMPFIIYRIILGLLIIFMFK